MLEICPYRCYCRGPWHSCQEIRQDACIWRQSWAVNETRGKFWRYDVVWLFGGWVKWCFYSLSWSLYLWLVYLPSLYLSFLYLPSLNLILTSSHPYFISSLISCYFIPHHDHKSSKCHPRLTMQNCQFVSRYSACHIANAAFSTWLFQYYRHIYARLRFWITRTSDCKFIIPIILFFVSPITTSISWFCPRNTDGFWFVSTYYHSLENNIVDRQLATFNAIRKPICKSRIEILNPDSHLLVQFHHLIIMSLKRYSNWHIKLSHELTINEHKYSHSFLKVEIATASPINIVSYLILRIHTKYQSV